MTVIRFLFAGVLGLHGILHLIGFVKEWHLARLPDFSGQTVVSLSFPQARVAGVVWLVTALLFLGIMAGFLAGKTYWWQWAWVGVAVSQILIVLYWPDAKAGTWVNVIILLGSLLAQADWNFTTQVRAEVDHLRAAAGETNTVVTSDQLANLPPIVQTWLTRSGVVGKERIRVAELVQKGSMRTQAAGKWLPVEVRQYFSVEKPAFIWDARIRMMPGLTLYGRDKYEAGRGNMLIKAMAVWPIADARGNEIDQGTLLRYLAETVWFPTAALSDYLHWEALTPTQAKVTMHYENVTASGVFTFRPDGDVSRFEAQRYGEFEGTYRLETWSVAMNEPQNLGGFRIPTKVEVTWKLNTGDFTWYKLDVTEIAYNRPLKN